MICLGRTKTLKRCSRELNGALFCHQHRYQWIGWLFSFFSIVGLIAGIYQDLWKPAFFPENQETVVIENHYRPKTITPQAFYLHNSLFSFIKRYPFDLHLGMGLDDFKIRYSGIVNELKSPLGKIRLYGLKKGLIEYDQIGRIDEDNTFFLFLNNKLELIILSFVFDPAKELEIAGKLDKLHPFGFGKKYDQGAIYLWISEKTLYSETLAWIHGYSSGVNSFRLFRNDFLLNDFLLEMDDFYKDTGNLRNDFSEFLLVLNAVYLILNSDEYNNYLFARLELGPPILQNVVHRYSEFINELQLLESIWNRGR